MMRTRSERACWFDLVCLAGWARETDALSIVIVIYKSNSMFR